MGYIYKMEKKHQCIFGLNAENDLSNIGKWKKNKTFSYLERKKIQKCAHFVHERNKLRWELCQPKSHGF